MLAPLIRRPRGPANSHSGERGVTLALVAIAMFSIIAMAGLAIDVGTLYQANAEAQRSADAAALAAARVLSLTGITGDPANSSGDWATACAAATTVAQTVANQDTIGGGAPSTVTVTYLASDGTSCGSPGGAFGVNPMVKVQVQRTSLPTYFARIWGRTGNSVSATATAEAFNPSGSATYSGGTLTPVQPRCVKPWIVPNTDPAGGTFVSLADGSITNKGIRVSGGGGGDVGESFTLQADCSATNACNSGAPYTSAPESKTTATTLEYVPALVSGTPTAVMSCSGTAAYDQAIAGCDQSTAYQCGVAAASATNPNEANLAELNVPANTSTDVQCLINESGGGTGDTISTAAYPYQITAGSGNPLNVSGTQITSSNSIVTLPIYDSTAPATLPLNPNPPLTIVGFLQVFIQSVPAPGSMAVTVLNVAGCGNASSTPVSTTPRYGTSPVPVRLITPP
jgi:Flp pilus assembly protein TadG